MEKSTILRGSQRSSIEPAERVLQEREGVCLDVAKGPSRLQASVRRQARDAV